MRGGFPIFRVAGIQVYLHFTWFLVAWYEIESGKLRYRSPAWAAAEYIGLFAIVLLHEFGHAFACRSTGGRAERIVLWPLGGLAFVDPPPRPAAVLWSIAAGPLVNVVLFPILYVAAIATGRSGSIVVSADAHRTIVNLWSINLGLLIFNLLPFYPLDGGQIVRALLWFKLGPVRSLMIAGGLGIGGAVLLGILAVYTASIWTGLIAFFLFSQAAAAIQRAREMALHADLQARTADQTPPPPDRRSLDV
jgi:Zn-dependent protease